MPDLKIASSAPQMRFVSKRKVRNIVTVSGRGVRGHFPSRKASEHLKYESLAEEAVYRFFEVAPRITTLRSQPCVLSFDSGKKPLRYTPDMEAVTQEGKFYVEIKAEGFERNLDVVARLRAVMRHMHDKNLRLILVIDSDVRAGGLQDKLKELLRLRPNVRRFRPDLDAGLWDPLNRQMANDELLERWESAKVECDALLERVMRRDPDALLDTLTR